jgi:O-acetyl-ADP-ribose deacetylase (regulator of RNase III)
MSKDLEYLLSEDRRPGDDSGSEFTWPSTVRFGRTNLRLEFGKIQDYAPDSAQAVIVLPANEYFDDECITDTSSSLGAYVQHHFPGRVDELLAEVRTQLVGLPSQRVPRAERRIDESYGIGQAILLSNLQEEGRVLLVSATTERTGIGLRAEPHFLYAALEGIIEVMNERRLSSLTIPVFGSGHGGMPLPIAVLFNILALRSLSAEHRGVHLRNVRIVIFDGDAHLLQDATMQNIMSYAATK